MLVESLVSVAEGRALGELNLSGPAGALGKGARRPGPLGISEKRLCC